MLHAVVRLPLPIALACLLCGCIGVTLEPDTQSNPPPTHDVVAPEETTPVPSDSTAPPSDIVLTDLATPHDDAVPPWIACTTHCDCPLANDCINERCVDGTEPIYCCTHPDCPSQSTCWTAQLEKGMCP